MLGAPARATAAANSSTGAPIALAVREHTTNHPHAAMAARSPNFKSRLEMICDKEAFWLWEFGDVSP